ncbi:hypothetical protein AAFF_G00185940, partial [Aldrovandia affinis]
MILQEKFDILHNICQQKDNALQQKLAQEEVKRCVKDIREINEINDNTQSALKTQIAVQKKKAQENWIVACALERTLGLEWKEMAKLSKKKAAQINYERRVKELKVKEVLRSHKQKAKTIEEQHQKAELSYKAE